MSIITPCLVLPGFLIDTLLRLADAVQVLSKLGGVKVQSIEGDSVVLELENDAAVPSKDQGANTTLILTIKFRLEPSGDVCAVFAGAEVMVKFTLL